MRWETYPGPNCEPYVQRLIIGLRINRIIQIINRQKTFLT